MGREEGLALALEMEKGPEPSPEGSVQKLEKKHRAPGFWSPELPAPDVSLVRPS